MKDTQDLMYLVEDRKHNLVNIVLLVLYKKMTMLWIDKESVDIFITVLTKNHYHRGSIPFCFEMSIYHH